MATSDSLLGTLSAYESYDLTPHIGTLFPDASVQLSTILASPQREDIIKDLATLISHRGVVFFSSQDVTAEQQKELVLKLGELTGRPKSSGLHKRVMREISPDEDLEVHVISSIGAQQAEALQSTLTQKPESTLKDALQQKPESTLKTTLTQKPESTLKDTLMQKPESTLKDTLMQKPESTLKEALQQKPESSLKQVLMQKPESTLKEALMQKPESSLKEALLQKPESTLKDALMQKPESTLKETLMQKPEPSLKDALRQKPESALKQALLQKPESTLKDALMQKPESSLKDALMQKPESSLKDTLRQKPESTLKEALQQKPESSLKQALTQKPESTLKVALTQKPESTLKESLLQKPESTLKQSDIKKAKLVDTGDAREAYPKKSRASGGWHSDLSFENATPDYTMLKMRTVPKVGGDTLWASTYEAYDRLSMPFKQLVDGLSAVHSGNFIAKFAHQAGIELQTERGSPLNSSQDLIAVHPVVCTNPVTGYKALFVNKSFTERILGLEQEESDCLLNFLFSHISENHDIQVRYHWKANDVAIWDNRAVLHAATVDYGNEARMGLRVIGIGERPYFDEESVSRREALMV